MKFRLLLITIGLSFIGIIPKFIKNSVIDWQSLTLYFFYIGLCFLSFYTINKFLWTSKPPLSYWTKFGVGLVCGFVLLTIVHLLLFNTLPNRLIYFLNLKEASFYAIITITAFRTFIIESIAFAYLFFLKNKDEKIAFQQEINHLNKNLNELRNNQTKEKEHKSIIITRYQDKVIPVSVSEIAFFHLSNGIVFQYLFSNHKYIQNESLESFENVLDPTIFYRANRQFLIHKKSVEKVEQIEKRKLKVTLTQPSPEEIIISKVKSSAFIKWLETY
ncbi:LytTR family DNA-binding domain-containing protein [Flectobacillus sp. BAB-3569]|uniref:LytR/AlgR family response regulator transcription factor n=1 Tax=Flectobacillus sp. BAB-3569 TaxID=1509483 RepID=UPI000BA4A497|nr:LytTR family DNA-binding domain-containing protein [Flectobacillus sp. BAB-3569]PAC26504.1 hypothetical protein BWI92_25660 [Flectobacillus sp. BAB-3569]